MLNSLSSHWGLVTLLLCSLLAPQAIGVQNSGNPNNRALRRRFDYRFTFKKPFFHNNSIPFFDYYDNVLPTPDFVRLSPNIRNLKGSTWSHETNSYMEWEVEFSFNIFGQSAQGGNGLAFWYTKHRARSGPIYGSTDNWDGLCVAFDTFDPSNERTNPIIFGFLNDGTLELGKSKRRVDQAFGSCFRGYRNAKVPVWARVSYYDNTIRVAIDETGQRKNYVDCFTHEGISLPTGYFFGLSASSSNANPDDHDVYAFETYEVHSAKAKEAEYDKISKSALEHMENIQKKVVELRHQTMDDHLSVGQSPATHVYDDMIKQVKETQFKIIDTLDNLYRIVNSQKSDKGASAPSSNSGGGSGGDIYLKEVQADLKDIKKMLRSLSSDGDMSTELKNLKRAIQDLQFKLDQSSANTQALHEETRARIHARTEQAETSVMTYVFIFLVVQVLAYVVWNLCRQGEKKERKFI